MMAASLRPIVAAVTVALGTGSVGAAPPIYHIDATVLRAPSTASLRIPPEDTEPPFSVWPVHRFKGPDPLETNELERLFGEDTPVLEVEIVSRPRVTAVEDQEATITIGQPVQYFEPDRNDTYRLVQSIEAGVEFRVRATKQKDGRIETECAFNVTWVARREPLEGTNLDVGPPSFRTLGKEARVVLPSGGVAVGMFPIDGTDVQLIVFVRVTEAEEE